MLALSSRLYHHEHQWIRRDDHMRHKMTRRKKSLLIGATVEIHLVLFKHTARILGRDHHQDVTHTSLQAGVQGLQSECNVLAFNVPALLIAPLVWHRTKQLQSSPSPLSPRSDTKSTSALCDAGIAFSRVHRQKRDAAPLLICVPYNKHG